MRRGGWSIKILLLALICATGVVSAQNSSGKPVPSDEQFAFKTVHIFNLKSGVQESDLAAILAEFNELFVKLGHPESQYKLWKLAPGEKTKQVYLWESNWQSKDVYDQVHGNEEYKKLLQGKFLAIAAMLCDHIYSKYQGAPIESTKE